MNDAIFEIVMDTKLYKIIQLEDKFFSEDLQRSFLDKIYLWVKNGKITNAKYHDVADEDVIDVDEDLIIVKPETEPIEI